MGKRQHQSDKLYITHKEWSTLYGGRSATQANAASKSGTPFKRLPFNCCALSFQPTTSPVCLKVPPKNDSSSSSSTGEIHGVIFELAFLVPYLKKYGINPITGSKTTTRDIVAVNFHKNAEGKIHCPVTYKVFTDSTKIACVATTGNVFSYDVIHQLNIKAKNMHDLIDDTPFTRKDIIILQDPMNPEFSNISTFYHVKQGHKVSSEEEKRQRQDPKHYLRAASAETESVMKELAATESSWKKDISLSSSGAAEADSADDDSELAAHYSTGQVAASFTSTHMSVKTKHKAAALDADIVRYKKIKSKGYVRFRTNFGDLNLELHCDLVPKTCENFLKHCASGYYKGTKFHRSIKNFMIQGGDPTGTGRGGESAFEGGKAFKDEFKQQLTHSGRGILSMANSGPNTNKSQFFITFRSCNHLDRKHTVFGRLVGGLDTLSAMEGVETDADDKPTKTIKIVDIVVFKDPFKELEEASKAERKKKEEEHAAQSKSAASKSSEVPTSGGGVGKYISSSTKKSLQVTETEEEPPKRSTSTTAASSATAAAPASSTAQFKAPGGFKSPAGLPKFAAPSAPVQRSSPSNSTASDEPSAKRAKLKKGGGGFGDFSSW